MLSGGLSPAQAIIRGYNKDKVFAAQQRFKRNNNLNDDGSKFGNGGVNKIYKNYYKIVVPYRAKTICRKFKTCFLKKAPKCSC